MHDPALVIMAAGMGSRFGGLKQMTPVDAEGHFLMDFSVYDAIAAGFRRVVFIIKEEMREAFEEKVGRRVAPHIPVTYVYQDLRQLPEGFTAPEGRVKPWGTAHAVLAAAAELEDTPFAVLNADDFYGAAAFAAMGAYLRAGHGPGCHAMVGYRLGNTLTEHGSVSRGVCTVDAQGLLTSVTERKRVFKTPDGPAYTEDGETYHPLPEDAPVSMNFWGFQPDVLPLFRGAFAAFLGRLTPETAMTAECLIPQLTDWMIREKRGSVQVLTTPARWYGVTYREDLPGVSAAIAALKQAGAYPDKLWENT